MNTNKERVVLLIPNTDTTLEMDLQRLLSKSITVHTERMWLEEVTVEAEKKMLEEEVPRSLSYLSAIKPSLGIFGCTSAGALYGLKGDKDLINLMEQQLGCKAISAFNSVLNSVKSYNPKKVSVITPYKPQVTAKVVASLEEAGFEVSFHAGMGKSNDIEIGLVQPSHIINYIKQYEQEIRNTELLFISCTNFRSLECKLLLEEFFELPVVTSNGAIIDMIQKVFPYSK